MLSRGRIEILEDNIHAEQSKAEKFRNKFKISALKFITEL